MSTVWMPSICTRCVRIGERWVGSFHPSVATIASGCISGESYWIEAGAQPS